MEKLSKQQTSQPKIDAFSSLTDDFALFGLPLHDFIQLKGSMTTAKILAMFGSKHHLFIYFYGPKRGTKLSDITLNHKKYTVSLCEENGFVQKYMIQASLSAGNYLVTEYGFIDDTFIRTTRSVKEEHVFGLLNGQYYYDSKRYFTTEIIGELFYDLIDMRTIKDKFKDILGRSFLSQNLQTDKIRSIKLYYVAFNLFDHDKKAYFVPEDIVDMRVQYTENRYVFAAKNLPIHHEVNPSKDGETIVTIKKETVKKEPRLIESGEKSDWNIVQNFFRYKAYRYDSIYKLDDHSRTTQIDPKHFSYALTIGPKLGYRYSQEAQEKKKRITYDIEETTLSNISIYHMTYQQLGQRYAVPVSSFIYESNKKSRLPRFKNRLKRLLQTVGRLITTPIRFLFGAGGVAIKIISWIVKHWKLVLIIVILIVLTILGLRLYNWIT
jgi:hypothetical protein